MGKLWITLLLVLRHGRYVRVLNSLGTEPCAKMKRQATQGLPFIGNSLLATVKAPCSEANHIVSLFLSEGTLEIYEDTRLGLGYD